MAVVLAAAVIVALLMFGSSGGTTLTAYFENAGQLVKGNQVKVGGRTIGSVTDVGLSRNGQAIVKMKIDGGFGRLHQGTTAVIRAPSLSGIANRYVSLQPGPNNAPELPDGAVLTSDKTTAPVEVDQIFDTFDPKTREGLRNFIRGSAAQYRGKGRQASESLRYLAPAISTTAQLTDELARSQAELERFVRDTSGVVTTLASRSDDLSALVRNAAATSAAIGDDQQALARTLDVLAPALRKGSDAFAGLRTTLDRLDPLVAVSKPVAPKLAPFFAALRPLVRDAQPTVEDLRFLIRSAGSGNDLTELTSELPQLASTAHTAFPNSIRALQKSQPVVEYIRPYTPDFTGWLQKFAEVAAPYDANGHYARVQPVFASFQYSADASGASLTAIPPQQRLGTFQFGNQRRCPGTATQNSDGSAPFLDMGQLSGSCDPSRRLPGP
ncbi:MAG: MCE family protein [Thermoleophilaceae bacterium]|nr:MCE family protein [Thermoleophilaceae bacterium]